MIRSVKMENLTDESKRIKRGACQRSGVVMQLHIRPKLINSVGPSHIYAGRSPVYLMFRPSGETVGRDVMCAPHIIGGDFHFSNQAIKVKCAK